MLFRKRGYYVTVDSWEGDGDAPATESVFHSTKDEAAVAVDMCRMFASHSQAPDGIGNLPIGRMELPRKRFKEFFTKHPQWLGDLELEAFDSKDEETLDDIVETILGLAEDYGLVSTSEYYQTRIAETITVQYFPHDVICEDVTDQF